MNLFQAIILGIVQGATEFLPVSSSAHLVIVPYLFNWKISADQAFVFDVLVQVATLAGVITYFWQDLVQIARAMLSDLFQRQPFASAYSRLGWLIILANIPAGIIGILLKDYVEQAFGSPVAVALFLLCTAALLLVAERLGHPTKTAEQMNWLDALAVGFSQALAIFPGVSRSGASITGGMLRGLDRPSAARFSFLMSIPIMLAAGLLAGLDLVSIPGWTGMLPVFIPGFLAAAVTGYLSIRWLLRFLTHRPLGIFSTYCAAVAGLVLVVYWLRL